MSAAPRRRWLVLLRKFVRNDQLVLLVLAVVMGAVAAYGAIAFRYLYLIIQGLSFGTFADTLYIQAQSLPAWRLILVPAGGGLLIGLFIHYFLPGRRPQTVADVIEAVVMRNGHIGLRVGLGAALTSAAAIGVGGSVGREGPVVHLGAALCSRLARSFGLSRSLTINLIGCGVAAAVSALFNAPIASTFFALEIVIGHYAISAFAPIVLASVTGALISRAQFGDFPAFTVPGNPITSALEFPAFALLGVVCAVAAIIMMRSIGFAQFCAGKVPLPRWSLPMLGGALLGVIALAFPQVLGVGYGTTDAALNGHLELWFLVALLVAKTAAIAICLGSGFAGGVFSPSLFIGAMVGGAFGIIATTAFPELSSGHSTYTLVGMGAVAGAVLGAPISTILIVFELTGDYGTSIAVMVAVVIASVITQRVYGQSFFSHQLEARGLNLSRGREKRLLASTHVGDVMAAAEATVPAATSIAEVREKLQSAPHGQLYVVDEAGGLHGTITLADLSEAAFETSYDALLTAAEVARTHPPVLLPDAELEDALELMEDVHEEHVAVVADMDSMTLVGVVDEVAVMLALRRALLRARAEERGEL